MPYAMPGRSVALRPGLRFEHGLRRQGTAIRTAAGQRKPRASDAGSSSDLVLSSGFLAFAFHAGFLQAVEEAGISVSGIMGTSSGALAGSLYAAGYSPQKVAEELCRVPPIQLLRPSLRPWRGGIMSLHKVVERLHTLLPATFDELPMKFACGVVTKQGRHMLVDTGSLPEAVAASAAVPFLFERVDIPDLKGGPFADGGMACRVGLQIWRKRRRQQLLNTQPPACYVHLVSRSSPFSGDDDVRASGESGVAIVRSPRSRKSLFSLGDYSQQMQAAHAHALPMLGRWQQQQQQQRQQLA